MCIRDSLETGKNYQELTDESRGARQTGIGERKQHHESREFRHHVDHAAIGTDFARMQAVVEHADAKEQCTGDQTMRDHLHHGTIEPERTALARACSRQYKEYEKRPHGDEAHVRDRGIGHELLHVLLYDGDERDIDDRNQRQQHDQPIQLAAGVRRDGQAEAQQSIAAHLQHDRGQDHGSTGRRFDVRVGQPGMQREDWNFDRERDEEREEQPQFFSTRKRGSARLDRAENCCVIETAPADPLLQIDDRDQHQR